MLLPYRRVIRPLLMRLDPEDAHRLALRILSLCASTGWFDPRRAFSPTGLRVTVAGVEFPNVVGLAAGCDKDAAAAPLWARFGFGFTEIGTVTAQRQGGNPRPRVFRFPQDQAIINRLGFNSQGSEAVAARLTRLALRGWRRVHPIGINIGKQRSAGSDEETVASYMEALRWLAPLADYVVVNVSSPNTVGLREWQARARLEQLLRPIRERLDDSVSDTAPRATPLFVKLSPDMDEFELGNALEAAFACRVDGLIATNTTLSRAGLSCETSEEGGLSGQPLRERALAALRWLYRHSGGGMPLIGVGGIGTGADAWERILAGATLVQLYTALVYQGPNLARSINRDLMRRMQESGVRHVSEVVGAEAGKTSKG
ncbi:MAG: quinone-dependent dihydroorotate dehydrogenase [Armatimonadetes bacterium]|nr:quinone-dependent dihydroorotate dehydrogenase [Armatimonadota bacterium]MDE2205770.1 quinone-dependent dihydroorotate dehydrogenase [Armatimonadota bacterium]